MDHMKMAEHHKKMHALNTKMAAEHMSMMEHHHEQADSSDAEESGADSNNPSGIEEAETPIGASFGAKHGFSHVG